MKPTIWIFSLEPLESRYTAQWHKYIPKLLKRQLGDKFDVVQVDGIQKNSQLTPGAFLNFSDTNYWKSSQLCAFLEHHNSGKTTADDHFLFTDAWNPVIFQIKYMRDLLGFNWTLHGLWHAGSYDPHDFLGRLVGDKPWVRSTERGLFYTLDHNYFATEFHIKMFKRNLLNVDENKVWNNTKIIQTGWPMEYMEDELVPYIGFEKKNTILFPHRIAPEKQVEIFRDLAKKLPQYNFVVCQDHQLTKKEYHKLLAESKIVFSASLQETLGIGCYEGCIVDSIPMVPDRLSYSEMYDTAFKYPSQWTENWDSYIANREMLCNHIIATMAGYDNILVALRRQTVDLTRKFFSCTALIEQLKIKGK